MPAALRESTVVSLAHYRRFLGRMWGVHLPFERSLDERADLAAIVPEMAWRRRLPQLRHDLERLGLDETALAALPEAPLPPLAGTAAALGALYILEGSTLGGHI